MGARFPEAVGDCGAQACSFVHDEHRRVVEWHGAARAAASAARHSGT